MYNTRKKSTANLRLIDNLIVSPNTSKLSMANSADWLDYKIKEASVLKQRLIVCVLSMTEWLMLNVAARILIRTYKFGRGEGTRWRSWLRHCATSRKVADSIPHGVTGIFHWHNLSGRTMALGLTHPLTEMSTRNISWGVKDGRCVGLTTYHFHVPTVLKSWGFNLLEPSRPVQACNGMALPLRFVYKFRSANKILRPFRIVVSWNPVWETLV